MLPDGQSKAGRLPGIGSGLQNLIQNLQNLNQEVK
jgi:hypothetical protein